MIAVSGNGQASGQITLLAQATVMVKLCGGLKLTPPLAMPPLSCRRTVITALPTALSAGVKVSSPVGLIAGWPAVGVKRLVLLLLTITKSITCPASLANPGLMSVI